MIDWEDYVVGKYEAGLVSVIIPTYRRPKMIRRSIDSVLNQTYQNIELLIVDDNVTGDEYSVSLRELLNEYTDRRLILVEQEQHINGAAARNAGIRKARGEYIAFLDDDDYWEFTKIERQLGILKELSDEWGGVSCKFQRVNKDGNVIGKSAKYRDGHIYLDILNLITDVTTCSLLLRHECLDRVGFFDEALKRHQDYQLLVNFTYKYKLKEVDEYLLNIDVSDRQNSPDPEKAVEYKMAFFESVAPIMKTLNTRDYKCVICMHNFELGYICLKNREIKKGIRYMLSVCSSFKAIILVIRKCVEKFVFIVRR